jgi:outer membrane immunogenic protein
MRNKLASSLAGAAFSFAAMGLAFAADIAVKAPPSPPPAPVYNWTGFYVGGNVGASFGRANTDFNAPNSIRAVVGEFGIGVGIGSSTFGFAGSHEITEPSGFIGGGQIGYNWQFSPQWVAGLEADFQGSLERDSNTLTNNFSGVINSSVGNLFTSSPVVGSTTLDYRTKIDWFGTVRGRVGYVWGGGNVMSYLTGGLAYGKVNLEGTSTFSGTVTGGGLPLPFSVTQGFGHSHVNTGWVVGSGTEGKLLIPGWTYKIEALYMDLGTINATGPGGVAVNSAFISGFGNPFADITATAGQVTTHTHFTDTIIRAGLNYQFH